MTELTLEELRAAAYEYRELPADFGDGEPEIVMRWFACIVDSDPPLRLGASFGSVREAMEYVADLKAGLIPRKMSFLPPPYNSTLAQEQEIVRLRARLAELEGCPPHLQEEGTL